MKTHADKTQENKTPVASNKSQKLQSSSASIFQFEDNRPEVVAHGKLQEMANNNPRAQQLKGFQEIADNSFQAKGALQLQKVLNLNLARGSQDTRRTEKITRATDSKNKRAEIKKLPSAHSFENTVIRKSLDSGLSHDLSAVIQLFQLRDITNQATDNRVTDLHFRFDDFIAPGVAARANEFLHITVTWTLPNGNLMTRRMYYNYVTNVWRWNGGAPYNGIIRNQVLNQQAAAIAWANQYYVALAPPAAAPPAAAPPAFGPGDFPPL